MMGRTVSIRRVISILLLFACVAFMSSNKKEISHDRVS